MKTITVFDAESSEQNPKEITINIEHILTVADKIVKNNILGTEITLLNNEKVFTKIPKYIVMEFIKNEIDFENDDIDVAKVTKMINDDVTFLELVMKFYRYKEKSIVLDVLIHNIVNRGKNYEKIVNYILKKWGKGLIIDKIKERDDFDIQHIGFIENF